MKFRMLRELVSSLVYILLPWIQGGKMGLPANAARPSSWTSRFKVVVSRVHQADPHGVSSTVPLQSTTSFDNWFKEFQPLTYTAGSNSI